MAKWSVVCADVLDWAKSYDGPPFHAILTDPPYHLYDVTKARPNRTSGIDPNNRGQTARPYGAPAGFMGKHWDGGDIAFDPSTWAALAAHLLPGAHVLTFGGSRTHHRLMVAIEDAGLEIRDCIYWCFGSGFPKSANVSKHIDRKRNDGRDEVLRCTKWIRERCSEVGLKPSDLDAACGTNGMGGHWTSQASQPYIPTLEQWRKLEPLLGEPPDWMKRVILPAFQPGDNWEKREVIGHSINGAGNTGNEAVKFMPPNSKEYDITAPPATPAAATWEGYGSALKPAVEVIVVARKPVEGTIAENCERYGSGALAIDACRIAANGKDINARKDKAAHTNGGNGYEGGWGQVEREWNSAAGRWPANLVLSHLPGCKRVGMKRVKGAGWRDDDGVGEPQPEMYGGYAERKRQGYTDPDGLELVDAWECEQTCPTRLFPIAPSRGEYTQSLDQPNTGKRGMFGGGLSNRRNEYAGETGSAARFFFQADWSLDQAEQLDAADVLRYCAKASRAERDTGLESFELRHLAERPGRDNCMNSKRDLRYEDRPAAITSPARNHHPTVKPFSLCRYLATLLLPPAAYAPRRILVPFGGVCSEAIGAGLAGWDEIVVVESEREYCDIGEARLAYWLRQPELALR